VLGHEDISTTERYGTISEDMIDRETARLEEFRAAQDT